MSAPSSLQPPRERTQTLSGWDQTVYDYAADTPRAAVLMVHGLGEHFGRYEHVARYWTSESCCVYGFDHYGHGKSTGLRGHSPGWELLLGQIDAVRGLIEADLGHELPIVLFGHSFGGLLSLSYLDRRSTPAGSLAAAIISAPALQLGFTPSPALLSVARLGGKLVPRLRLPNEIELAALSRDPAVASAFAADPLTYNRISARLASELLSESTRLRTKGSDFEPPCLLIHGDADRVCHVDGSRKFALQSTAPITLRIWSGHFHELHNEPDYLNVLTYSSEWLRQHLQA